MCQLRVTGRRPPRWADTRKALGIKGGPLFCTRPGPLHAAYVRNLLCRLVGQLSINERVTLATSAIPAPPNSRTPT